MAETGVFGLIETPAFTPQALIVRMAAGRSSVASMWIVMMSGARFCKAFDVAFRFNDHQVRVEHFRGDLADGREHGKSERKVRDEHAVHHVDVDPFRFAAVEHFGVAAQVEKIGRQDRR